MRIFWPEPKWTLWLVPGGLIASGLLLAAVLLTYPDKGAAVGALAAAVIAGFTASGLALAWSDTRTPPPTPARAIGIKAGLTGGALWLAEIAFNNVSRSSAATRLVIDDTAWGVVAFVILAASFVAARRGRFAGGLSAGFWGGTVSGVIACLAALSLVVFFMPALTGDPLNIAEYAARVPSGHPAMAAYFAYETLVGALGHLLVLGTVMGLLLGAIGGTAGTIVRRWLTTGRRLS